MSDIHEYRLTITGEPVPKGRPRVYRGIAVTPKKTRDEENRIRTAFQAQHPQASLLQGNIAVEVTFWKSHRGRPDFDNLVKLVTDALNGLAYKDDSQIKQATIKVMEPDMKVMGTRGLRNRKPSDPLTHLGTRYEPHTDIRIHEIPEQAPFDVCEHCPICGNELKYNPQTWLGYRNCECTNPNCGYKKIKREPE